MVLASFCVKLSCGPNRPQPDRPDTATARAIVVERMHTSVAANSNRHSQFFHIIRRGLVRAAAQTLQSSNAGTASDARFGDEVQTATRHGTRERAATRSTRG